MTWHAFAEAHPSDVALRVHPFDCVTRVHAKHLSCPGVQPARLVSLRLCPEPEQECPFSQTTSPSALDPPLTPPQHEVPATVLPTISMMASTLMRPVLYCAVSHVVEGLLTRYYTEVRYCICVLGLKTSNAPATGCHPLGWFASRLLYRIAHP
jgi:hypothetical protein